MKEQALQLLRDFTEAHGAPGHEDDVRRLVQRELSPLGELTADRLGSVMLTLPGEGPRVMLTAHMDEVGFMVQHITDKGFLQIMPLGGWWTHTLLAQRVRVKNRAGQEIIGVVTSTPPHFLSEAERSKVIAIEHLYIDVGARSREDAIKRLGLALGDPIVPESSFFPREGSTLCVGKAFDNRAGLSALVHSLHIAAAGHRPCRLLGVATVQEEIGCRGALTAAALAQPDVAIVLECAPADDTPGHPAGAQQAKLGAGPQLRLMDPTALMNPRLNDLVIDLAAEKNIPLQVAVRRSGGTDAKHFHTHHLGVPTIVLSVPGRYIHSHQSVIDLQDYYATVSLVTALVQRLDQRTVESLTDFLA
jgi:putative aminopeptidase FrvX